MVNMTRAILGAGHKKIARPAKIRKLEFLAPGKGDRLSAKLNKRIRMGIEVHIFSERPS